MLYAHYSDSVVSKLIKNGKFYNKKDVWEEISKYYAQILVQNIWDDLNKYILVPVPMHFWKKSFRWYNQCELLVKHISQKTWIQAEYKLLKKTKKTQQQSHLTKKQRFQNLKWSFRVNKKLIDQHKNKTIILIDDVISTGATLNTASQLLRESGIENIVWCVFASD